jgi:hypothetical protein
MQDQTLTRQERLDKAILSFKLLILYSRVSLFSSAAGLSQPFHPGRATAATFAETFQWHHILNSSLGLILCIIDGDANWSFSRLGTRCLENFFGLIQQNSRGDDVLRAALLIIARTCVILRELHALHLRVEHRGRDNL